MVNDLVRVEYPLLDLEQYPSDKGVSFLVRGNSVAKYDLSFNRGFVNYFFTALNSLKVKLEGEFNNVNGCLTRERNAVKNFNSVTNDKKSALLVVLKAKRVEISKLNKVMMKIMLKEGYSSEFVDYVFFEKFGNLFLDEEIADDLASSKVFVKAYSSRLKLLENQFDVKRSLRDNFSKDYLNELLEGHKKSAEYFSGRVDYYTGLLIDLQKFSEDSKVKFHKMKVLPVFNDVCSQFEEDMILNKSFVRYVNFSYGSLFKLLNYIKLYLDFDLEKYCSVEPMFDDKLLGELNVKFETELFYYLSGIQVLTIKDKFGSALSNLLSIRPDLKNDDEEKNDDVKQTRLDAVKSCRYMIPFSDWIFNMNFDDDRTLDERRTAWIRQTMSQCESVSSSKMDVNSFIGGSERQKKFACKKRDEI